LTGAFLATGFLATGLALTGAFLATGFLATALTAGFLVLVVGIC